MNIFEESQFSQIVKMIDSEEQQHYLAASNRTIDIKGQPSPL